MTNNKYQISAEFKVHNTTDETLVLFVVSLGGRWITSAFSGDLIMGDMSITPKWNQLCWIFVKLNHVWPAIPGMTTRWHQSGSTALSKAKHHYNFYSFLINTKLTTFYDNSTASELIYVLYVLLNFCIAYSNNFTSNEKELENVIKSNSSRNPLLGW